MTDECGFQTREFYSPGFRDVIPCDMVTFCDKTCLPEIL